MSHDRLPTQITVWRAAEVARSFAGRRIEEEGISSALKATRPGDRAFLYQAHGDPGVVGIVDMLSAAAKGDLGWMAWSRSTLLGRPIARAELLADEVLRPVFQNLQGRQSIPPTAARRLVELIERDEVLPPPADEALHRNSPLDVRWVPAGPERLWGNEATMQRAICDDEDAWRSLGYNSQPELEVHPPNSSDRMDLYGDQLIVECKVFGDSRTLAQVDRYLRHMAASGRHGHHAAIVVARGFSRALAAACAQRDDVDLVVCLRDIDDRPQLVAIDGPDARIDWPMNDEEPALLCVEALATTYRAVEVLGLAAGIPPPRVAALKEKHNESTGELLPLLELDASPEDALATALQCLVNAIDFLAAAAEPLGVDVLGYLGSEDG